MKELKKEVIFAIFSIKKNISSALELRGSFLFNMFAMSINNTAFLVIWISFGLIAKDMNGWQAIDVLGMLGIGTTGYGLAFAFFGGIRGMPEIVSTGTFDKYLLSPKGILLRISTSTFSASAVGDFLFGIITLSLWFYFTSFSITGFIFAIIFCICSGLIFYFYSVLVNSVAFYFLDSRSVVQGLFEFLITPSLFYGGAFQGLLRFTFIFIVPSLLIGAFPVEVIKSESFTRLFFVIFLTAMWGVLSMYIFHKSIRKYESSNFINFG